MAEDEKRCICITRKNRKKSKYLETSQRELLYKKHLRGALVRSGGSLFMLLLLWISLFFQAIPPTNVMGIFYTVLVIVLINFPFLWLLKRVRKRCAYEFLSILLNFMEIICYTAIIYFLGGIKGAYFAACYAVVISYTGAVAPRRYPFIVATMCGFCFSLMIVLQYTGYLPDPTLQPVRNLSWANIILMLVLINGLLYIIASTSAYAANLLAKNREKLCLQNLELEKSRTELAKLAEDLKLKNRELKQTTYRARQADRAKSEFLANMSHELRTPLNHIIGFTELILDRHFGDLNETQQEYLGDVLTSSRHLLSLINDILDLSKVEAGKLTLELGEVHVESLLKNSITMIKQKSMKHGIKIITDINGLPERIIADERKLKQIMYNLLSNAVKFTPDGREIRIKAHTVNGSCGGTGRDEALDTSQECPHNRRFVKISIIDQGIGIREEYLGKIFLPFEQVDSSITRKYEGTGLGLSLTKRLVELHGGQIWAESEGEGKGSTFTFTIPEITSGYEEHENG